MYVTYYLQTKFNQRTGDSCPSCYRYLNQSLNFSPYEYWISQCWFQKCKVIFTFKTPCFLSDSVEKRNFKTFSEKNNPYGNISPLAHSCGSSMAMLRLCCCKLLRLRCSDSIFRMQISFLANSCCNIAATICCNIAANVCRKISSCDCCSNIAASSLAAMLQQYCRKINFLQYCGNIAANLSTIQV